MKNKFEYRIEDGSLIIDNYFNNLKIGSINCGSVENILNKCKLYDGEYETLLKENEYMKHIAKDFEQLQQENNQLKCNWNKLREYIKETKLKEFEKSYGKRYGKTFTQAEIVVCNMILDKMLELEKGSDNNE
jgi:hypothetical protein